MAPWPWQSLERRARRAECADACTCELLSMHKCMLHVAPRFTRGFPRRTTLQEFPCGHESHRTTPVSLSAYSSRTGACVRWKWPSVCGWSWRRAGRVGYEWKISHLEHVEGPAAHHSACAEVAQLQAPAHGDAVRSHLDGSSEKKIDRDLARSQRRLLIVHGGQPPSLLLECCGEQRATLKLCGWGSPCGTPLRPSLTRIEARGAEGIQYLTTSM